MAEHVQATASEYGKFITIDVETKLTPINKSVDNMLARLEEFQTMISFSQQERIKATTVLDSLMENRDELNSLFARIDAAEKLVKHVRGNLESLEAELEKAEEDLGIAERKTNKVTNIFTPLFKKNTEKKATPGTTKLFQTIDYFQ